MNLSVQKGTHAQTYLNGFHTAVLKEVQQCTAQDSVVVIGMAFNPHVASVRRALDKAGIPYTYLQYGGYFSRWKARLAIKMWSGWPTFPQVFAKGVLIGGNVCTRKAIQDGSLQRMLTSSDETT